MRYEEPETVITMRGGSYRIAEVSTTSRQLTKQLMALTLLYPSQLRQLQIDDEIKASKWEMPYTWIKIKPAQKSRFSTKPRKRASCNEMEDTA